MLYNTEKKNSERVYSSKTVINLLINNSEDNYPLSFFFFCLYPIMFPSNISPTVKYISEATIPCSVVASFVSSNALSTWTLYSALVDNAVLISAGFLNLDNHSRRAPTINGTCRLHVSVRMFPTHPLFFSFPSRKNLKYLLTRFVTCQYQRYIHITVP